MKNTPFYPMFVSLDRRLCLVVGGGAVGERKIRRLLDCGASVRVVARGLTDWLHGRCREGNPVWAGTGYEETDLDGVDMVFAATNDMGLNRRIAEDASRRGIWCNMVTDPELGSFLVPSVIQRGSLAIAVSTTGQSPAIAKMIRQKLEEQFGPEWAGYLDFLGLLRKAIQARQSEGCENQELFRTIASLPILEMARERERAPLEAVHEACRPWLTLEEINLLWNEAWKPSS